MTRRYSNDPRLIFVKYDSKCSHCGTPIAKGESALYYPAGKKWGVECRACARPALDALADERNLGQ